jgi:hypothetical protein
MLRLSPSTIINAFLSKERLACAITLSQIDF